MFGRFTLKRMMFAAGLVAATALIAACSDEQAPDAERALDESLAANEQQVEALETALETMERRPRPVDATGVPARETVAQYRAFCEATLNDAQARFEALEAFDGEPTRESLLEPLNDLFIAFEAGARRASLWNNVHPDPDMRAAADECQRDFSRLSTEIGLSRPIYDAVSALDVSGEDAATQHWVTRLIRNFERAGVNRDEETRARIREINEELTKLSQNFRRTIAEDVRHIEVTPEQLEGLPQDYIDARQPGEDGRIRISTEYPDLFPFMTYARDDEARRQLRVASRSRGYPDNAETLKSILEYRYELANLVGFDHWADYITDDKMAGSADTARDFVRNVGQIVREPAKAELEILLTRLRQDEPEAERVQAWQHSYLTEIIRQEQFDVDSREVRQYFRYDRVRDGIFEMVQDLFGVEIRDWNVPVWHESVTAHEFRDAATGELLGLFYLDMHPREGKFSHAAHFSVRRGVEGRQIALSALVCNFPTGLMEHGDVETFLHEFGHLIHALLGGRQEWVQLSGVATEWDFVEAPSMMLEEWVWDYDSLKSFAINDEGETIPAALVERMNAARHFGNAIGTGIQVFYGAMSLAYYDRHPDEVDLLELMKELQAEYSPYPYVDGTHFYANFGHLDGYSAMYYTYQWSLAIALDIFSRFEKEGMRNTTTAMDYRRHILEPGGSKPAARLVENFLNRPYNLEAFERRLLAGVKTAE
jgi:thimet oligopeptidase